MTGLRRAGYEAAELDPLDGPPPTYANPGAVENPGFPTHTYDHECGCGVRWRGDDPCWNCGGDLDAVA